MTAGTYPDHFEVQDEQVELAVLPDRSVPMVVLLEIPPQETAIILRVATETYGRPVEDDDLRYYYEEHTCPINYLRDVLQVKVQHDDDPHGLARLWPIRRIPL